MHDIVIADTSVLIVLHKIDALYLLEKLYGKIYITPQIAFEFAENLPSWIEIKSVKDKKYQILLATQIDIGEASAIALTTEFEEVKLIIDDIKARKLAQKLNFKVTGTLGVINKAKHNKVIDKIKPFVDKILSTDFRIDKKIVFELLRLNNEID